MATINNIQRTGKPGGSDPFYIKKAEAYSPLWEGEWDSIKRRRKARDPLMKGGRCSRVIHTRVSALFN